MSADFVHYTAPEFDLNSDDFRLVLAVIEKRRSRGRGEKEAAVLAVVADKIAAWAKEGGNSNGHGLRADALRLVQLLVEIERDAARSTDLANWQDLHGKLDAAIMRNAVDHAASLEIAPPSVRC